jgi:hypothetical protein
VGYKIKQKANNPQGSEIKNQAQIYFDFNDPIITNEWINIVDNEKVASSITSVSEKNKNGFEIFPNPVSEKMNIITPDKGMLTVYSSSGTAVLQTTELTNIDLSNLEKGTYIYNFTTESELISGMFFKQ